MRSAKELFEELQREAAVAYAVAIAIAFERRTEYVFDTDPDALERLDELLAQGGMPLGLMVVTRHGDELDIKARPYRDGGSEDQEFPDLRMANLVTNFAALIPNKG